MTPRRASERGNPAVEATAKTLQALGVNTRTGVVAGVEPSAGHCVSCGKVVDPMTPVSHGLRGSHTCVDPAGVVPPYLDPGRDGREQEATGTYRLARRVQRQRELAEAAAQAEERKAAADPTRPF